MTPPTTDTSREAVSLNLGYINLPGGGKTMRVSREIAREIVQQVRALLAERDAAILREKSLKDSTEELRQLQRKFSAVNNQRDYNRRLADHQKTVIDRLNSERDTLRKRVEELTASEAGAMLIIATERAEVMKLRDQLAAVRNEVTPQEAALVLERHEGALKVLAACAIHSHACDGKFSVVGSASADAAFSEIVNGLRAIAQEDQSDE